MTQLHSQHTKICLLVSPDQLQTIFFLNRQNFNKDKITLSLLNIIMLPQYLMVSMTYQIGSKLCNYSKNNYIREKQYYEHVLLT